jgi:hypothetical protein
MKTGAHRGPVSKYRVKQIQTHRTAADTYHRQQRTANGPLKESDGCVLVGVGRGGGELGTTEDHGCDGALEGKGCALQVRRCTCKTQTKKGRTAAVGVGSETHC